MEHYTIASATHIGHANLKVADLNRALSFYHDALGFRVRATPRGGEMVVLGASESSLLFAIRVDASWRVLISACVSVGSN
jgi:catechol-2,3-dioxygenase